MEILKAQKVHIFEMRGLGALSDYRFKNFHCKSTLTNECRQICLKIKDDLQILSLLSCSLGHHVERKGFEEAIEEER